MTIRRILATSGGFIPGPVQQTVRPGTMLLEALTLTGVSRPRVCLVLTASGDADAYYAMLYECFNAVGCDVTQLRLFPQPTAPPEERLVGSDLVWVGGGSVANLLSLWRLHGVDDAMRAAWEAGVILAGVSAGSLCWHVGGTTDSFGSTLRAIDTGLALVPYANGVHYDSEPQRRPLLHRLVTEGVLPPVAYATDDHVGIWYRHDEFERVVTDQPVDPDTGPAAYRVERAADGVIETRLGVG
ncbi:MAG: Type 1 glutamine amidotransferase-like domain-containing protein [Acidimicrobiales bacterium]